MGAKELSIASIKISFEEFYYKKYQRNDKEADGRNTKQDFFKQSNNSIRVCVWDDLADKEKQMMWERDERTARVRILSK